MVGKFISGQASEALCKSIAESIADMALSTDFTSRAENLKACLLPQLFSCNCRLMVDDLMSLLPIPTTQEDAYGADHLANFNELLWNFVLVPILMTERSNCTNVFVRLFTSQEYGNSTAHIDTTEQRIIELVSRMNPNLFFIKGQSSRGVDVGDHFLYVSLSDNFLNFDVQHLKEFNNRFYSILLEHICVTLLIIFMSFHQVNANCQAMKQFYVPLKKRIECKLAAREVSKHATTFNMQQVMSLEIKAEGSGVEWLFGCSEAKMKRMAPTHARITTPFVPLGMFTEEQRERVYEVPIVPSAFENNRFSIPGTD